MDDKFEKSNLTAIKSKNVDAPIVTEFPLTLECEVVECQNTVYGFRVLGKIVNVLADEKVLDENNKVDPTKLNASFLTILKSILFSLNDNIFFKKSFILF